MLKVFSSGEPITFDHTLEPRIASMPAGSNRFSTISEIKADPAFVGVQNGFNASTAGSLSESTQPSRAALSVKDKPLPTHPSYG